MSRKVGNRTGTKSGKREDAEVIYTSYGRDESGQWYWVEVSVGGPHCPDKYGPLHGPFRTKQGAKKDLESVLFGPRCNIIEGGQWDPAWETENN